MAIRTVARDGLVNYPATTKKEIKTGNELNEAAQAPSENTNAKREPTHRTHIKPAHDRSSVPNQSGEALNDQLNAENLQHHTKERLVSHCASQVRPHSTAH